MSITSVDRGAQDRDDVQHTRNEYQEREAQTAKRQKKEVQTLTNEYEKDLEKLATDYDHRATKQSKHVNEALTDKDRKYQGEINELKKMHVQKLRDMTEKNQTELLSLREEKDKDIHLTEARHDRQENEQRSKFEGAIQDTERSADKMTNEAREKSRENLGTQRKELNRAHEAETDRLRASRDGDVGELKERLQRTQDEDRRTVQHERDDRVRDHRLQDKRFMDTIGDERRSTNQVLDEQRGGSQRAIQAESEKYSKALRRRDDAVENFREDLTGTVNRRQDDQINRLQTSLNSERAVHRGNEAAVRKMSNTERDHITQQYQNRFDELERRGRDQVVANNEIRKKDVELVHKTYGQALESTNKKAREEVDLVRITEVEPYKQEVGELEMRDQRHLHEAELRGQKLTKIRNRDVKTVADYYDAKLDATKSNSEELAHDQNLKAINEKTAMMQRYEQKVANVEASLNQKHETSVAKYEEALLDTKSKYENELRRQQELNDQKYRDQDRRAAADLDRERSSNLVQQNSLRDHYEKELDFLRKRNEQEKIELAKRKV